MTAPDGKKLATHAAAVGADDLRSLVTIAVDRTLRSLIAEVLDRMPDANVVETQPTRAPVYPAELKRLRQRSDMIEVELHRRYVQIGTLPITNTIERMYYTPKEILPKNPGPRSKWAERRAHLEGKR